MFVALMHMILSQNVYSQGNPVWQENRVSKLLSFIVSKKYKISGHIYKQTNEQPSAAMYFHIFPYIDVPSFLKVKPSQKIFSPPPAELLCPFSSPFHVPSDSVVLAGFSLSPNPLSLSAPLSVSTEVERN